MGRHRTIHQGLPLRMTRDARGGTLRYKRPDTGAQVYLGGMPETLALKVGETLNAAFGPRPPRGMRHLYRDHFIGWGWEGAPRDVIEVIAVRFADVLPMLRRVAAQEQIRHSWAFSPPEAGSMRKGLGLLAGKNLRNEAHRGWIRTLYLSTRKNAKARGIGFELSEDDLLELVSMSGGRCAVTNIALSNDRGVLAPGRRMRRPWAPSVDRVDSAQGYTRANCRIVCCAANYAMSQWGEDVLLEMAKAIARRRINRIKAAG